MGTTYNLAADAFRSFVIDGVPSSGPNDPDPNQIIAVFADTDTRLGALEAGQSVVSIVKATWTALSAIAGTTAGQRAEVFSDTGAHTDPVNGVNVPNAGVFSWVASPAGWQWIAAGGLSGKADLNSPSFIGTPGAPTAPKGTSSTQLATTQFVQNAVGPLGTSIAGLTTAMGGKASQSALDALAIGKADKTALDAANAKLDEGLQRSSSLFPQDRPGDGAAYFTPRRATGILRAFRRSIRSGSPRTPRARSIA